jgi:hypothetical protein
LLEFTFAPGFVLAFVPVSTPFEAKAPPFDTIPIGPPGVPVAFCENELAVADGGGTPGGAPSELFGIVPFCCVDAGVLEKAPPSALAG